MNVVHEDVEQCVENELQHAVSVFGLHHSNHEKMAVIVEEYEECAEAVEDMRQMMQMAWTRTRDNMDGYMMDDAYGRIYDAAVKTAIEAIQVAAMAKKEIEKPKEIAEPAELDDHGLYSGHDPVRVFRCTNCGNDFVACIHPHPLYCPMCGEKFSNVLML